MRMNRLAIFTTTLLIAALVLTVAATADQHSGTWKMNPTKSWYSPGPAPRDVTVKVNSDENGIKIMLPEPTRMELRPTLNTVQNSTARITRLPAHTPILCR